MADAPYSLPDLPYDYGALEPHVSGQIMELHHDKHHAAYVKGANAALDALAQARASDDLDHVAKLQRDLAFNVSGHVLHSIFWTNLSPDGGGDPTGQVAEQLQRDFGGFDRFKKQFTQTANTVQGSGWALAAWEPVAERVVIQQVHDHQGQHGQGMVPLLAFDAWEHAFYLQYKNVKADFFDALWNVVNWSDVERRLADARD
jgi:superoxide dismutase, Fe-Mn family